MSSTLLRRLFALAAAPLLLAALTGCAVVTVAGVAASAAVSVGSAAVSVGSAVVGTTAKVASKVVEKTIDIAVPSGTTPAP
ncbi:MAG: hypothetical protein K8R60_08075 [Burkholderiales bacterium]|nr:hypothetical protein [Burkholderiales bacterium]